jgi:hypothetical protein
MTTSQIDSNIRKVQYLKVLTDLVGVAKAVTRMANGAMNQGDMDVAKGLMDLSQKILEQVQIAKDFVDEIDTPEHNALFKELVQAKVEEMS